MKSVYANTLWFADGSAEKDPFMKTNLVESAAAPQSAGRKEKDFISFRPVPHTGVIYVMEEATARGFQYGAEDWANLGQGAPEAGALKDSPPRLTQFALDDTSSEYAPVAGLPELRQRVADLYNQRYRKGMASQYTYKNVCISAGGRAGLARIAAALGQINLGHFLPDYTAYEELLDLFRSFVPIPIVNETFRLPDPDRLEFEVISRGLGALLLSNPVNPTGQAVHGSDLAGWVQVARKLGCTMIFDEFYSHYFYGKLPAGHMGLSASPYVQDVNEDPVLIVDGLTKNWRYPGLRLSWTVGPEAIIRRISSVGSFLDGGAPHPIQKGVLALIDPKIADQEAQAIRHEFAKKRRYMMDKLLSWGLTPDPMPMGGFYFFPSIASLPAAMRDGMDFFRAALEQKVITVPGAFFDVNPGQRRSHIPSRLKSHIRLSYGPPMAEVKRGMERLEALF